MDFIRAVLLKFFWQQFAVSLHFSKQKKNIRIEGYGFLFREVFSTRFPKLLINSLFLTLSNCTLNDEVLTTKRELSFMRSHEVTKFLMIRRCLNVRAVIPANEHIYRLIPYRHTTCIPRWNDMETTVSTSFQRGIQVLCLQATWNVSKNKYFSPSDTHMYILYQKVGNVSFTKNFAHVLGDPLVLFKLTIYYVTYWKYMSYFTMYCVTYWKYMSYFGPEYRLCF